MENLQLVIIIFIITPHPLKLIGNVFPFTLNFRVSGFINRVNINTTHQHVDVKQYMCSVITLRECSTEACDWYSLIVVKIDFSNPNKQRHQLMSLPDEELNMRSCISTWESPRCETRISGTIFTECHSF